MCKRNSYRQTYRHHPFQSPLNQGLEENSIRKCFWFNPMWFWNSYHQRDDVYYSRWVHDDLFALKGSRAFPQGRWGRRPPYLREWNSFCNWKVVALSKAFCNFKTIFHLQRNLTVALFTCFDLLLFCCLLPSRECAGVAAGRQQRRGCVRWKWKIATRGTISIRE